MCSIFMIGSIVRLNILKWYLSKFKELFLKENGLGKYF